MADEAKRVVDPATVTGVQAAPAVKPPVPPAPAKKVFRFFKWMSPANPVTLAGGKQVKFIHTRTQAGGFASTSHFETEDEKLADAIRKAGSAQHVTEIK